jgi:predicted amidophosphoribosyltransferase
LPRSVCGSRFGLAVPRPGPGVCATCHGPARDGGTDCWCCRTVSSRLGHFGSQPALVVPVSLCRNGDPLHVALRGYKDAPVTAARRHFAARTGLLVRNFLTRHATCIRDTASATWDSFATVPSSVRPSRSSPRDGDISWRHPFDRIVQPVLSASGLTHIRLVRAEGELGHLVPDPHAFGVVGGVRGRRVLLVDDTWVTGARMRSAASALSRAGAVVVAMVAVGRIVDIDATTGNARWWSWAESSAPSVRDVTQAPCCLSSCQGCLN